MNVYSGLEHPFRAGGIHCMFVKKLQNKNNLAVLAILSHGEFTRAAGQTMQGCVCVCVYIHVTTKHTLELRRQA